MHSTLICFLIIMFLPLFLALGSAFYRLKQFGKVDLALPRIQAEKLTAGGHRIISAQKNAWEALIIFGSTMLLALLSNTDSQLLHTPAILFVIARVLHGVFYIAGLAILRTLSFVAGMGNIIWMMTIIF